MPRGGRRSTSFKPGKSANPGGRPKHPEAKKQAKSEAKQIIADVKEAAKAHTPEMLNVLVTIAKDVNAPQAARASSAQYLIDRGWGRPTQQIEANVSFIDQLGLEDKRALLAAVESLTRGDDEVRPGTQAVH